jgi:hypothetical protein
MSAGIRQFIRHYVEMVIAMLVGMAVLLLPAAGVLRLLGSSADQVESAAPGVALLGMAVAMTAPMVAWMRYRGHSRRLAWEMSAAMFVPTLLAIIFMATGAIDDFMTVSMIQHNGMFAAMLAAMVVRRDQYGIRAADSAPARGVSA